MYNRELTAVSARLESTVCGLLGDDSAPIERYLFYEMIAIQILDSEFAEYPDEVLAQHLKSVLLQKRLELGVNESDLA